MTPGLLSLLADLAADGVEFAADGDRLRYRPVGAVTPERRGRLGEHKEELLEILREAGWGVSPASELVAGARREQPVWSEDAEYQYLERLGVADDLDMDLAPGSPAELTARREADMVATLPPGAWPGTHGAAVIAHATAVFGQPPRPRNPEHPAFQSGHVEPVMVVGESTSSSKEVT